MELTGTLEVVPDSTAMTRPLQVGNTWGELQLIPVSLKTLDDFFMFCAPSLKLAMNKTDELSMSGLLQMLEAERATLVVEFFDGRPQGCVVTTVVNYHEYRALEILAIAALPAREVLYPNKESMENLKAWARQLGCKRIQGFASESVMRLWRRIGFKEVSRKVEIKL